MRRSEETTIIPAMIERVAVALVYSVLVGVFVLKNTRWDTPAFGRPPNLRVAGLRWWAGLVLEVVIAVITVAGLVGFVVGGWW